MSRKELLCYKSEYLKVGTSYDGNATIDGDTNSDLDNHPLA